MNRLELLLPIFGILIVTPSFSQNRDMVSIIEKQQHELSQKVTILEINLTTWWMEAYPKGAPFKLKDRQSERRAAWHPKYEEPKGFIILNDGLGCISFIRTSSATQSDIPALCGPVDLQIHLAMEELREEWENLQNVPRAQNAVLDSVRDSIPMLWAEEKTLYCTLQPDSSYIGLGDSLERCSAK